ncbi:MAG: transposase [Actinomycetota bacterium]|nr:transposase [Actinomycetota bacterium]
MTDWFGRRGKGRGLVRCGHHGRPVTATDGQLTLVEDLLSTTFVTPTEVTNLIIKKIKRSGHGFRDFDNYRLRLPLDCGTNWDTQQLVWRFR